jgi:hypothetical protein
MNANQETKQPFEIEAIEVDMFGPDGRLKDIWMFRCVCLQERVRRVCATGVGGRA